MFRNLQPRIVPAADASQPCGGPALYEERHVRIRQPEVPAGRQLRHRAQLQRSALVSENEAAATATAASPTASQAGCRGHQQHEPAGAAEDEFSRLRDGDPWSSAWIPLTHC